MNATTFGLTLFSLVITTSLAAEQRGLPIAEIAGEPSALVAGCVNAITGNFNERQTDFVVPGAGSIVFNRYYNSSDWEGGYLCDGWGHNYGFWCVMNSKNKWCTITSPMPSGGNPVFGGNKKERNGSRFPKEVCTFVLDGAEINRGLTNCGAGAIGGRTNLKNSRIEFRPGGTVVAWHGDGSTQTFTPWTKHHYKFLPCQFFMRSERKPNGHEHIYDYDGLYLKRATAALERIASKPFIGAVQGLYLREI